MDGEDENGQGAKGENARQKRTQKIKNRMKIHNPFSPKFTHTHTHTHKHTILGLASLTEDDTLDLRVL